MLFITVFTLFLVTRGELPSTQIKYDVKGLVPYLSMHLAEKTFWLKDEDFETSHLPQNFIPEKSWNTDNRLCFSDRNAMFGSTHCLQLVSANFTWYGLNPIETERVCETDDNCYLVSNSKLTLRAQFSSQLYHEFRLTDLLKNILNAKLISFTEAKSPSLKYPETSNHSHSLFFNPLGIRLELNYDIVYRQGLIGEMDTTPLQVKLPVLLNTGELDGIYTLL